MTNPHAPARSRNPLPVPDRPGMDDSRLGAHVKDALRSIADPSQPTHNKALARLLFSPAGPSAPTRDVCEPQPVRALACSIARSVPAGFLLQHAEYEQQFINGQKWERRLSGYSHRHAVGNPVQKQKVFRSSYLETVGANARIGSARICGTANLEPSSFERQRCC